MAIPWSDTLLTGIEEIDTQHRELNKRLNRMLDACRGETPKEEIEEIIAFLESYFATHLKTEEDLMKRVNFPGYLEHKEAHETILLEFGDLKRSLMEEGIGIHTAIHVNRLMTKWFITHISKLDQEYGRFIKKQNITS